MDRRKWSSITLPADVAYRLRVYAAQQGTKAPQVLVALITKHLDGLAKRERKLK